MTPVAGARANVGMARGIWSSNLATQQGSRTLPARGVAVR